VAGFLCLWVVGELLDVLEVRKRRQIAAAAVLSVLGVEHRLRVPGQAHSVLRQARY